MSSEVAVLVLNYNGLNHLSYSIPNILSNQKSTFDLIVIDNNSSDKSLNYLYENFKIKIIESNINLGYAGGNNLGLKYVLKNDYKYVIIANNDILVSPNWVSDPLSYMNKNLEVACLGYNIFGEYTKVDKSLFFDAATNYKNFEIKEVENIPGMLMFIRVEVLKRVGLFDDIMFMYGEEDDLEYRIKECGYKIVKCNIPIWHFSEGTTSKYIPIKSSYLTYRNNLRSYIKFSNFFQFTYNSLAAFKSVLFNTIPKEVNSNVLIRRKYPTNNRFILFYIVAKAVLWNLLYYFKTKRTRKKEIYVRDCWNN
jgi:GT2 family glycosyltransferase